MRGHDQQTEHNTICTWRDGWSDPRGGAVFNFARRFCEAVGFGITATSRSRPVANVRDALRRRLGDLKFDAWIAPLELVAEVNGEDSARRVRRLSSASASTPSSAALSSRPGSQADRNGRSVRVEARERHRRRTCWRWSQPLPIRRAQRRNPS